MLQTRLFPMFNLQLKTAANFHLDSGDEEDKDLLIETAKQHIGVLNDGNQALLNYLSSEYSSELLKKNKMKINIESGKIFIDNPAMSESLYGFLCAQQDLTKKILIVKVLINNDFDCYVKETLANISNNRNNMNSNSTSKFLFYTLIRLDKSKENRFLTLGTW